MNTKIIILSVSLITIGVMARIISPFQGWGRLQERSANIIIARCGEPTPSGIQFDNATKSDSNIEIISTLKGTNQISSARLLTDHSLRQGENYLVFGYYDNGIYQAYEEYRVIPLGVKFSTNSITGKSFDEKIQILLHQSVNHLNQEIQSDEAEKQRLEEGLKN